MVHMISVYTETKLLKLVSKVKRILTLNHSLYNRIFAFLKIQLMNLFVC